jgi:hypothetical protein
MKLWVVLCSAITSSSSLWTRILAAGIIVKDHNLAAEGLFGHDTMYEPAPQCVVSHWHDADAPLRCCTLPQALSALTRRTHSRKPVPAHTVSAVPGAPRHAPTHHRSHPPCSGLARALVRLAPSPGRGATRNLDSMASPGVPALLALAVHPRTSAHSGGPASPYPSYGAGESDLGPGAHCQ